MGTGESGRPVTWAERVQDRDLHLQFLPWNLSGMNSLDIKLDVVFENFVTSPVYLSLYTQTRSFRLDNFVRGKTRWIPRHRRRHRRCHPLDRARVSNMESWISRLYNALV